MRALIRNPGETVTENDGIVGIDWDTGAPLTNDSWSGGPYVLVENYGPDICEVRSPDEFAERAGVEISDAKVEIADTEVEFTIQERGAGVNHTNTPAPETVTIDGKTYTKDELLALLNQTS